MALLGRAVGARLVPLPVAFRRATLELLLVTGTSSAVSSGGVSGAVVP